MGKSYKKNPICTDKKSAKKDKQIANGKVRSYGFDIPNGKAYKKIVQSYDIHDCRWRNTLEEFIFKYESDLKKYINGASKIDPDSEKNKDLYDIQYWYRVYRRK